MKRIIIFIPYFGTWPFWFDVFLTSCEANPTINWYIHTDCEIPAHVPSNVQIVNISFHDYCALAGERIGINFKPKFAYSLCNLKPALGYIHEDLCDGYDYFGFGDLDVVYGDIRSVYTDDVLKADAISSHGHICSGHFFLLKNVPRLRSAFFHAHEWREILEDNSPVVWDRSLDEARLSILFTPCNETRAGLMRRCNAPLPDPAFHQSSYFVEQWSTPFVPGKWRDGTERHPETWFWKNGTLTNCQDIEAYLYLHFMNFKSERWVGDQYRGALTWDALSKCLHFDGDSPRRLPGSGEVLRIDRSGIYLDA